MLLLVGSLGLGVIFLEGDGLTIGVRENQEDIVREIGLWTPNTIVGQTFRASRDKLCQIDFRLDSFHPWDTPFLDCRLFEIEAFESVSDMSYEEIKAASREVRERRLNGWFMSGHMFNSFFFEPILDSKGKFYLFSLQSTGLKKGGTSIVLASHKNRYPYYGNLFINGKAQEGDLAFRALYLKPRTQLLQQSFEKLALQKPFPFSYPITYYGLFGVYIGLLSTLLLCFCRPKETLALKGGYKDCLKNFFTILRSRKKLYWTFLIFYPILLVCYSIVWLRTCKYFRSGQREETSAEELAILVIQLQKIGDLVCTTPVFRELRARYPYAHITAMVLPITRGILQHNPHINDVISYHYSPSVREILRFARTLKERRFTWSFNLSPNFWNIVSTCCALIPNRIVVRTPYVSGMTKSVYWTHSGMVNYDSRTPAIKAYLKTLQFIGITKYAYQKEIYIGPDDVGLVEQFLENYPLRPDDLLIALHPFAGVQMKEWGHEKFVKVGERLVEQYKAKILLIGASQDREKASKMQEMAHYNLINTCGMFTLSQLPALLKRCQLFISVDTGPLYIADALGISVVNIAGPCDMNTQKPDGKYEIVQKSLSCVPCSFIMNAPRTCKRGDRKCLELVTVEDVMAAIRRLEVYFMQSDSA